MCDKLSDFRNALGHYNTRFDPSLVTPAEAAKVVREAAAIEAMASTLKSLAATRAAESGSWKKAGHRSAAEALATQTGTSISAARDALDTGRRLMSQPELSKAARTGKLSFAQTSLISNASEQDPSAETRLLEDAARVSVSELKDACARTKAASWADSERRREEIHRHRSLRSWMDLEGVWHLHASGNPEGGAQVMAALSPIENNLFETARRDGRREPQAAYAFDSLVALAREATSAESATSMAQAKGAKAPGRVRCGAPVKLLVRIDYDTFLRGLVSEGETCELVGYGQVPVSVVNELIETGDPFVAAILAKGERLTGVAHLGRKPTAYQASALEWLYPSCAAEGCASRAHLEADHRVDWSKTHFTVFDLLDRLCSHHHDLKTQSNWALVEGDGKRPFVAPEDPRHPGRRKKSARAPSEGLPIQLA